MLENDQCTNIIDFPNNTNKQGNASEFKNAKTLKEAKEYANRFSTTGKSRFFNTIRLENINQFNKQMTYLTKKYNYNEFIFVGSFVNPRKTSIAHACKEVIEIEAKFAAKSKEELKKMFDNRVTNYQLCKRNHIIEFKNYIKRLCYLIKQNPDKPETTKQWIQSIKDTNENIKDLKDSLKYSRKFVLFSAETFIKDTITHEFGHALMDRAMKKEIRAGGFNNKGKFYPKMKKTKTFNLVLKTFKQAIESGDIYKISKYSRVDHLEFFAECFVIYDEDKEQLPDYINNMFKEVLKI